MQWTNHYLFCALIGWFVAQFLKGLLWAIQNKEIDISRFFGAGGMPSSHSALVCSMAVLAFLQEGFSSPLFGVMAVFSFVVVYDASGVRFEVGKQAKTLNQIIASMRELTPATMEQTLKEFVGHTKLEVFAGVLLGITVAICYHYLILKGVSYAA